MTTSRLIDVEGMTVHLLERGSGVPIILLHGGLATAAMSWNEALPLLAAGLCWAPGLVDPGSHLILVARKDRAGLSTPGAGRTLRR